jgi:hypothetical protein
MFIKETLGNICIILFAQMPARGQCASGKPSDLPSQNRLSGYLGFPPSLSKC